MPNQSQWEYFLPDYYLVRARLLNWSQFVFFVVSLLLFFNFLMHTHSLTHMPRVCVCVLCESWSHSTVRAAHGVCVNRSIFWSVADNISLSQCTSHQNKCHETAARKRSTPTKSMKNSDATLLHIPIAYTIMMELEQNGSNSFFVISPSNVYLILAEQRAHCNSSWVDVCVRGNRNSWSLL